MTDTEVLIYNFKIHTILGKDPRVCFSLEAAKDIVDEIKERDAKIAQLEREADWLAEKCVDHLDLHYQVVSGGPWVDDPEMKSSYWREAARGAVSNAS